MAELLEVDLEREMVAWVEMLGGFMPKFTSPGRPGAPDRMMLLPQCRPVFIEVKRPGEEHRFQPGQKKWHRKLRRLGNEVWVIDDMLDFVEKTNHYMKRGM